MIKKMVLNGKAVGNSGQSLQLRDQTRSCTRIVNKESIPKINQKSGKKESQRHLEKELKSILKSTGLLLGISPTVRQTVHSMDAA